MVNLGEYGLRQMVTMGPRCWEFQPWVCPNINCVSGDILCQEKTLETFGEKDIPLKTLKEEIYRSPQKRTILFFELTVIKLVPTIFYFMD